MFWSPASLFSFSKNDKQPSPVKGPGGKVTPSARSTVPFRATTTSTTTVSPAVKNRRARGGVGEWWSRSFLSQWFGGNAQPVSPDANDKKPTQTSSSSSTATTAASPEGDVDRKPSGTGRPETGEGINAKSPEKIGQGTETESPEKIGQGTGAESPQETGEGTNGASSRSPVEKNEVLIWKEPDDPATYPRRDLPALRGLGLIMAGIVLAAFSTLTVVPVILGAVGTARYVGSLIDRDMARRTYEDEERRYAARREIVRARRRRLWLQTFYSSQARKAAAEKAKKKWRKKKEYTSSEGGREENEKKESLANYSDGRTSPEEKSNFLTAGDKANEEGETAEDGEEKNA